MPIQCIFLLSDTNSSTLSYCKIDLINFKTLQEPSTAHVDVNHHGQYIKAKNATKRLN